MDEHGKTAASAAVHVPLRQLLAANVFKGYRIFAGEAGLDNMVSRVTIIDVPDALDWLDGKELICTTGYVLSKNPEIQTRWLTEAAKGGAAGIIIKPERFLGQIPECMVEIANQYNLPLIGIPINVLWSSVIQETMDILLERHVQTLQNTYEIHHRLEQVALSSSGLYGLDNLLNEISEITECHVELNDKYGNRISANMPLEAEEPQVVQARQVRMEHIRKYDVGEAQKHLNYWLIPGSDESGKDNQVVIPVIAGEHKFGWLSASPVPTEKLNAVRTILEHGSAVVALFMLGRFTGMQARTDQINQFYRALLKNAGMTISEIMYYEQLWGVDLTGQAMFLRLRVQPLITENGFRNCIEYMKRLDKNSLVSAEGNDIYILYHPAAETPQEVNDETRRLCFKILSNCHQGRYECFIGVGEPFSIFDRDRFHRSYQEAELCVEKAQKDGDAALFYQDLGVARIFPFLQDKGIFSLACKEILKPLLEADPSLMESLKCYIESGFNKVQAAKKLCVHVNTLNYRLDKIQEALQIELTDVNACILYYIAMYTLSWFSE